MKNKGDAIMGIGTATGEYRAREAAISAINSPLLDGVSIAGAEGVLVNITAREDVSMAEVGEAVQTIEEAAGEQANLIFGVVFNQEIGDAMMVTVVATGFNQSANLADQPQALHATNQPQIEQHSFPEEQRLVANGSPITYASERPIPEAAPIGQAETAKYNTPAYLRRNSAVPLAHPSSEMPPRPSSDKPAFLRRIMD